MTNETLNDKINRLMPEERKECDQFSNHIFNDWREQGFNLALSLTKQSLPKIIELIEKDTRERIVKRIEKECKFEYFLRSSAGNIVRSVISKKDEMRNEMADQIIKLINKE